MDPAGEGSRTCSTCGYSSPHAPQFVELANGSAARTFCAYCADREERRSFYWNVVVSLGFVVLGSLWMQSGSRSLGAAALVVYGTFLLAMCFVAFPHELAHALMARCVGLRPVAIEIGRGVSWLDRWILGVRVRVQLPIHSGGTYAVFRKVKGTDWRFIATTAAAGVFELMTAALLFVWFWSDELHPESRALRMVLLGCVGALLVDGAWNLWPRTTSTARGETRTDGLLIWRTFKREAFDLPAHRAGLRLKRAEFAYVDRRFDEAIRETAKARALSSHPAVVANALVLAAESLSESGRPNDAVEHLRPWLDREDLPPEMRAWVAASFAWATLLVDDPALMEEGLRRLDQALPHLPWNAVVVFKLLALLAATARDEERHARMRRVAEGVKKFRPHGEARAYAALARGLVAAVSNDSRLARTYLDEARRRGATRQPLQVLERRIASL